MEPQGRTQAQIPVFRAKDGEDMAAFGGRCREALARGPACTGPLPLRVAAVEADAPLAKGFVAEQERWCADSFGQAVVCLDRDRLRRGWYVTLFPDMEREGLPCEVLCLDMTGPETSAEDVPELAVVLEFFGRFCQQGAAAFLLAREPDALTPGLEAALTKTE